MNNLDFDPRWYDVDKYGILYPKTHTETRFCPMCNQERTFFSDALNPISCCMVCEYEED